jgi:hypothetical protein
MDKNKFWLGGRLFNTASPRLGAPTQPKSRPQDGRPNATQGTSASWAPQCNARHVRKLGAPTHVRNANARHATQGTSARPQVGRPNATQGTSARWSPKRKTHPQRKGPHKGALGQKTRWRMDKNKFWLGGRIFNTASRHVRKARPQVGRPDARPQRKRKARPQVGRPNARPQRKRKARPQFGRHNATQGTSARWSPKRKTHPQRKHPHKGALG